MTKLTQPTRSTIRTARAKPTPNAPKVSALVHDTYANVPGFDSITKILNSTDSTNREKLISALEKKFPDIYNILKSNQPQ